MPSTLNLNRLSRQTALIEEELCQVSGWCSGKSMSDVFHSFRAQNDTDTVRYSTQSVVMSRCMEAFFWSVLGDNS